MYIKIKVDKQWRK